MKISIFTKVEIPGLFVDFGLEVKEYNWEAVRV